MRKSKSIRQALLCGASLAIVMAGMAWAQDDRAGAPAGEAAKTASSQDSLPKPDAIPQENLAPALDSAPPGGDRPIPKDAEPDSAARTISLDTSNLIDQQEAIGADILLLDRQMRRAEMIGNLIGVMGIEGFRREFPELAKMIQDSPILLQAELEENKLLAQIEMERQKIVAAKTAAEEAEAEAAAPALRNDGSTMFVPQPAAAPPAVLTPAEATGTTAPVPPVGTAPVGTPPVVTIDVDPADETPAEKIEKAEIEEPKDIPISLREIYGTRGNYSAVITHGGEKIRVVKGDNLPGDTTIDFVGEDYIKVSRRGKPLRFEIRG